MILIRLRHAIGAFALLVIALEAHAHDLITAAAAEAYLARTDADLMASRPGRPVRERAEALYDLGRMLDEVRELLNRDLAMHGRVQGLPSNFLVSQLQARHVTFDVDPLTRRFRSPDRYFAESLRLAADLRGGDAAFRLLRGRFYDSFDADPLQARLDWAGVQDQIRLGEALRQKQPPHPEGEETAFILTVHYLHAMRLAPPPQRAAFWQLARSGAIDFAARYPDSMRRAALDVLIEVTRPGG